jgi:hypothetical protein
MLRNHDIMHIKREKKSLDYFYHIILFFSFIHSTKGRFARRECFFLHNISNIIIFYK